MNELITPEVIKKDNIPDYEVNQDGFDDEEKLSIEENVKRSDKEISESFITDEEDIKNKPDASIDKLVTQMSNNINKLKKEVNDIVGIDDFLAFENFIEQMTNKKTKSSNKSNGQEAINKLKKLYLTYSLIDLPEKERLQIKDTIDIVNIAFKKRKNRIILDGYHDLFLDLYKHNKTNNKLADNIADHLISFFEMDLNELKYDKDASSSANEVIQVLGNFAKEEKIYREKYEDNQTNKNKNSLTKTHKDTGHIEKNEIMSSKQSQKITNYFLQLIENKPEIFKNILTSSLGDIFSLHPEKPVQKMLGLLRDNKYKDIHSNISDTLYRLEFGKIGISEEGVKYLEKIYDLGEYNNPDYHVSRLTADGEIGIFNEEKELIKYIKIGDLSSEEKKIKANVLDFTYDTLFIGKKNETAEEKEKRLKYLEEFKKNYYKIAGDKIFEQTGVRLNNLSFKEQGWFIIYFNEADDKKKEDLKQFIAKFNEDGIKTFLALESDNKNGDKILKISKQADKNIADKIFKKFNEISFKIKQSNQELSKQFFKGDKKIEPSAEIIKKASKILIDYENKIEKLNYTKLSDEEKYKVNQELIQNLSKIKKDIIFFTAMFKTAYKEYGELDFEEVKNTQYEHLPGNELSEADINIMKSIYLENFQNYPEEFRENLLELFDASIKKDGVNFDILRYQGKIVGFMKFENQDKDKDGLQHKHFGAFNISKDYHNGKLGEVMLKKALDREKKNSVIHAECDPEAPITNKYFELGFKEIDKFVYKGVPSLHIEMREQDVS